jgi:methyl-accepting chemotaxis protein
MFSNIRIGRRLLLLISVLTLTFMVTGAVTLIGMSDMSRDTAELNQKSADAAEFTRISSSVRYHLVDVSQLLASGAWTWQEARKQLEIGAREFDLLWSRKLASITGNPKAEEFFSDAFGLEAQLVKEGFSELLKIVNAENRGQLSLFLLNDARGYSEPFLNAADALSALESVEAQKVFDAGERASQLYLLISIAVVIIGLLLAATLGPFIYLSITRPIKSISNAVRKVSEGDLGARTSLTSKDEIGQLGYAFDSMLNERVTTMATAEDDNEKLNNSIIELLEAVSDLSDRDRPGC